MISKDLEARLNFHYNNICHGSKHQNEDKIGFGTIKRLVFIESVCWIAAV
jgi:hypothetical protein